MNHLAPFATDHKSLSAVLKAAADELRTGILQVLAKDSYGVLELAKIFEAKQSGMSHHLKILDQAGLVVKRREGNSIFYRRSTVAAAAPYSATIRALFEDIDKLHLQNNVVNQLSEVWQDRSSTSKQFFLENAAKFQQQQELIANFEVYRPYVDELLELVAPAKNKSVVEIGPGEGLYLNTLCTHFGEVWALDNSSEMLKLASATAGEHQLKNIQFIEGDTSVLGGYAENFDCAVANMVLHHTPSPAKIFSETARSLKTGGSLIITELCQHDQVWATEACGDLWLGFTPEDLSEWAKNAGLDEGQSSYFALRNGFQIQVRQFVKVSPLGKHAPAV